MSFLIINTQTNKVTVQMVDQPEADLIAYENETLVIKVPGHSYWVGRCMERGWSPAAYQVYKPTSVTIRYSAREILVQADRLLNFPLRVPKGDDGEETFTCVDLALKNLHNHATLQLGEALDEI